MEIRYTIYYHPKVLNDDIPTISSANKKRIQHDIEEKLMISPEMFGKPLRQSLRGYRKLRVGDYRIIFRIEKRSIFVLAIMHRSVVYERVEKRNHS